MQARHAYLLAVIATRLNGVGACDYLVFTASIYASVIPKLQQSARRHLGPIFFPL